jgi:hypothetical protein
LASDDRWCHPELVQIVLDAWKHRLKERARKAAQREKTGEDKTNVPRDRNAADEQAQPMSRGTNPAGFETRDGIGTVCPVLRGEESREGKKKKNFKPSSIAGVPRARPSQHTQQLRPASPAERKEAALNKERLDGQSQETAAAARRDIAAEREAKQAQIKAWAIAGEKERERRDALLPKPEHLAAHP